MFTALYPLQHRVQNNHQRLDASFVTLAERLSGLGYETAAFVSVAFFGDMQIAQGFNNYDQPELPDKRIRYRPADQTTDAVVKWLNAYPIGRPLFLWVHYYDPHMPLRPPAAAIDQVAPRTDADRERLLEFLVREHHSEIKNQRQLQKIIKYDAEIRFVDAQLERLYDTVHQLDQKSSTLWVITSDHGQGLGNHRWFGHHRYIYNEHLHVPLLFHFSQGDVRPRIVADQLVEHVDVPVTILDLAGEAFDNQKGTVQGRSLLPLLLGERRYEHKRFSFSERRLSFGKHKKSKEPGERYALQTLDSKYQWFTEGSDEYYDLSTDPYETRNLIDQPDPVKEQLRDTLKQIVAGLRSDEEADTVEEKTLESLRALGYLR